jgi:hypothetical protein
MLTGLDRGVQFRLEWETDVNFEARTVRGLRRKGRRRELVPYFVPMNDDLLGVLRALPLRCRSRWVFPKRRRDGAAQPAQLGRPHLRTCSGTHRSGTRI